MKLRSWLAIGIIIIGIIVATSFYTSHGTNNVGITIKTNGTGDTTQIYFNPSLSLNSPPSEMKNEIVETALEGVDSYNSTADSIKTDINNIAKKYGYAASVTIISQFGTDQLPMLFQVNGTSMVPTLQNGQNIMVLKTKDFQINDLVVAYYPPYNCLIVKRLTQINGDQVYLKADNTHVTTVPLGNGMVEIDTPLSTWDSRENVIGVVKVY